MISTLFFSQNKIPHVLSTLKINNLEQKEENKALILFTEPSNTDCNGAISLPINYSWECNQVITGTFKDVTKSSVPEPSCNTVSKRDVWYEFTATSNDHQLRILNVSEVNWVIEGSLYDKTCGVISTVALECFTLNNSNSGKIFSGLVLGRVYRVRLGTTDPAAEYNFDVCLTTPPPALRVSPSGNLYSVDELVKDVLVKDGNCIVSNIKYQVGDGSAATKTVNTFGYFNKNGSLFPFEEGVVLSTGEVQYVPGPYGGQFGNNPHRWIGDKEINDAIDDAGGGPTPDKRVTQVSFDFFPVNDKIQFEYLFASNSYYGCFMCQNMALFATWLIDTTTGEGINLAKIPGTTVPIALHRVIDRAKDGATCGNITYPEYFWMLFANNNEEPLIAPINFVGMTVPMKSEEVTVVPGRKYHIKLAVMDFCTAPAHTSAVFFNARSFDVGTPEIGEDMSIEGGNALCPGDTIELGQNLEAKDYLIQWTKNGKDLIGENGETLKVNEPGL
ncbi:choice-of-anchor L domain-containing protein, partial [Myroides indicus]